jgi:hypothetical protein
VSEHAGLPRDDNGSVGGYAQAIGPDGAIYAVWADGDSVVLTTSQDGGRTFGKSHPILETGPPYFGDVPGVSRVDGFPQIAIDPLHGKLFVSWSDYRNGDIDVFASSSGDRGRTWSEPIRVNSDPLHNGSDQFYQWMAVDPATGFVYLDFYDRRDDPSGRNSRITLARSTDGGRTFANYAWSERPFEARGAFLGDYTWIAAYNNRVYAAWTETVPPGNGTQPQGERPETKLRIGAAAF